MPWGKCQALLQEVEVVEDDIIEDINLLSIENAPQAAQLNAIGRLLTLLLMPSPR